MSSLIRSHQYCTDCGSSDALAEYTDHTYCFSCQAYMGKERDFVEDKYTYEYIEYRGIRPETFSFYGVKAKVDGEGKPVAMAFPYENGALKIRNLERKDFYSLGSMAEASLFGMDKFGAGSAKAITITEGELDALSVFQIMGSKYPAVSIRSASSAGRDCSSAYEYLNSFERIYLAFDNDEPGERATAAVARLFDVNKIYHVKLTRYKDANEYLERGFGSEFSNAWWNSKRFLPRGVLSNYSEIEEVLKRENKGSVASYPFLGLQDMTYGVRNGEVVLITAQEGVGKTEVLRTIEHHLLKTTDDNIAIIHLEESDKRSVQGLIGLEVGAPVHFPDSPVSTSDQIEAYKRLTKQDGRLFIYSHFGSDDPDTILEIIRYLAAVCNCKFITLDHITMIVTGHEGDDERKKLDYISTRLATLTRELGFTLFLVSHVNDDGKTRGSRNISKVADLWLSLERDTDTGSKFTNLHIRKNRFTGRTGTGGILEFDSEAFRLNEVKLGEDIQFDPHVEKAPLLETQIP